MKYFLIFFLIALSACKKEVLLSRPSFKNDKIHIDYEKRIKSFEAEYVEIKKSIDEAQTRINDSSFAPKMAEIIKNEIFVQEKYLRMIYQEIAFLKTKDNDRSIYYGINSETLTDEIVQKDFEDYQLSENANPKKYIWRMRPGLILPPDETKAAAGKDGAKDKDGHKEKGHEAAPAAHH